MDRDSATRRCAGSSPTTRARPACASSSARSARSAARSRARGRPKAVNGTAQAGDESDDHAEKVRELLGRAALPRRGQAAHGSARRGDRPGLDAGRRRRPVHRGQRHAGHRQAAADRPARRRHEGVRAGGADLGQGHAHELAPELGDDWFADHDLHVHVPGGRDAEGRPERRHHDGDRARLADLRAHGARGRRDDRRDHADRAGPADRRPEGEGAGGPAQRDQDVIAPALNEADAEDIPEHLRQQLRVRLGRGDRRGARRRARKRPRDEPRSRRVCSAQSPTPTQGEGSCMAKKKKGGRRRRRRRARPAQNPYVQRVIEDEDLRDNVRVAFEAARDAYERLSQRQGAGEDRSPTTRSSTRTCRHAAEALQGRRLVAARGPQEEEAQGRLRPQAAAAHRRRWPGASRSARTCATSCSTRSSAPRRSSTTRRPPRRLRADGGPAA